MNPNRSLFALPLLALWACAGCSKNAAGPTAIASVAPSDAAPPGAVKFEDISGKAHVDFTHNNGAFGSYLMPEIMGSGAAFIDYDGDGYPDIFLVNGRDWTDQEVAAFKGGSGAKGEFTLPKGRGRRLTTCALYHNNRDGTFTDVTKQAGLDVEMYGMGVAVGDYDNDGWPDLYVTALGRNYLFHNEKNGTFKEVAAQSGVQDSGWSTSACWVDYDRDGKLDLFVCHYVKWSPGSDIFCNSVGDKKDFCTPEKYTGERCRLYHNEGGGKFRDVSATALKGTKLQGKSLGVSVCDFNGDGWPDIIVSNDTERNYLFQNNKDGTLTDVGTEAGIAFNEAGTARAAMGVDSCDIDHSGRDSIIFGNFSNQMLSLYQNTGAGLFVDQAARDGVGPPSLKYLAFGTLFVDIDDDGWPDAFVADGHVVSRIGELQRDVTFKERPLLFHNDGRGKFTEVGLTSGEPLSRQVVGRGVAAADIDLDGYPDILLTCNGGKAMLLHNSGLPTDQRNNAIRLVLQGTRSNRSAIGAVVETRVGADSRRSMVHSGGSYCSASELPLTIGLGKAAKADSITVIWPDSTGTVTHLDNVAAGSVYTVDQDKGIVKTEPLHVR